MSSVESKSIGQTPNQEAWDRVLEQIPVGGLPRLITVEHLRSMLAAARGRVRDDHVRQKNILDAVAREGGLVSESAAATETEEGDEMGGISVAGDTTINITVPPDEKSAAAPTPTATAATSTTSPVRQRIRGGIKSFVIPAILGAGSLGAGAAGMAIYNYFTDKPDSITTITQPGGKFEYRYGIEQRPTPSQ